MPKRFMLSNSVCGFLLNFDLKGHDMNKLATLLIGSALTTLMVTSAFAADTAPAPAVSKPAVTTPAAATAAAPATPNTPAVAAATAKEQAARMGSIDMAKIAAESTEGKAAATTLKAKSAKLRAKIEAKQKQLEKQKEAIESKLEGMSAKERAAKGKEFQKKMEEYQKLVRASEEEMQQLQEKLTADLYKKIKSAATAYAKSHDILAVVEQKAMLYVTDKVETKDLTEEIAGALNEKPSK
jgi:outer membrane protein